MYTTTKDALAISSYPHLMESIRVLAGEPLLQYLKRMKDKEKEPLAKLSVGKLHLLQEGGAKHRVIAIGDY
jgi:hypothetical protein